MTRPAKYDEALKNLERRHRERIETLHPSLRERVNILLQELGGRFRLWDGWRSDEEQRKAYAAGFSNAGPGQSPHNCVTRQGRPCSRAADLVLHPGFVVVRAHLSDPRYPDLWDPVSPEAAAAWESLDTAAKRLGLVRVSIGQGRRRRPDLPHVELPDWRSDVWRT